MSKLSRIVLVFVLAGCAVASVGFTASAQVGDDFDSYEAGRELVEQANGLWGPWCGATHDAMVVNDRSYHGQNLF